MNKRLFGNDTFKPLQREIINATKSNKDVIGLLPTGGGKSLTFQLTAHTEEGVTLIIYPLISLIANQKEILRRKGLLVIDAKDFSATQLQQILNYNMEERVRLIVTTPEYLSKSQSFMSHLDRLHGAGLLARFVIDEAHCLVQWGNSFREDYLWLGSLRENYPGVPILALSATLSHSLENQLIQILQLQNPILFRSDLNRPNIQIKVVEKPKNMLKSISLAIMDKFKDKSGIIYCSSRNNTEKTANQLRVTHHINCEPYHAGMNDYERKKVQERWMKGITQVVVATIAFGLGIDKPDVRFVMHICFPKSLENYIQEIGRCGRDGKPAIAILYYRYSDRSFHNFHIESSIKQVLFNLSRDLEAHLLYNMLELLQEPHDCLRKRLLKEMGQEFLIEDCKMSCSNCKRRKKAGPPLYKDFSTFALILLRYFHFHRKNLTVLKLIEAAKSKKKSSIPNLNGFSETEIKEFKEFVSSQNNTRRLCIQMLKAGVLKEEFKELFQNVVVNLRVSIEKERELKNGNLKIRLSTSEIGHSTMPSYCVSQSQKIPVIEPPNNPISKISQKPVSIILGRDLEQESNFSSLKDKDLLQLLSNSFEKENQYAAPLPPISDDTSEELPPPYNLLAKSPVPKKKDAVQEISPQFLRFPLSNQQRENGANLKAKTTESVLRRNAPSSPKSNLMNFLPEQNEEAERKNERQRETQDERKKPVKIINLDLQDKKMEEQQQDLQYFSLISTPTPPQLTRNSSHLKANSLQRKRDVNLIREEAKQASQPFSLQKVRFQLYEKLIETRGGIKVKAKQEEFAFISAIDTTFSLQFLKNLSNFSFISKASLQYIPIGVESLKRSLKRKTAEDLAVVDCYGMDLVDTIKEFVAQKVREKLIHSTKENVPELMILKQFVETLGKEIDEALEDLIEI